MQTTPHSRGEVECEAGPPAACAPEHGRRPAAGRDEGRGLVEGLVQVALQRRLRVKQAGRLADLPIRKVCDDLGDELDDLWWWGGRMDRQGRVWLHAISHFWRGGSAMT